MLNVRTFYETHEIEMRYQRKNRRKQRQNNNWNNNWKSTELLSISAWDFKSLCFKIPRIKVAKSHIFYKVTIAAKKLSISLKYSNKIHS